MTIRKTALDKITSYRNEYFSSMPEFQELFIELMIAGADCYLLQMDNKEVGYAIKNSDGILIEFYVLKPYIPQSNDFFRQVLTDLSVSEIFCKSFDSLLLNNCLRCGYAYEVIGVLYRDYAEPLVKHDTGVRMVKADLSSVETLLDQDDSIKELFETEQQLIDFIQNGYVFEFYLKDVFIGCGTAIRTNPDWDYCDLGVWVKPSNRGSSYGSQIILNLRNYALINNLKPSCGCAIDNIASQKTIVKSGFVSKHQLINFKTRVPEKPD
ncbi:MAG: GNAT family N-acetyltransferase [Bacteroidota bacterium]